MACQVERSVVVYSFVLLLLSSCTNYFSSERMDEVPHKGSEFRSGIISYLNDQIRSNPSDISSYLQKAAYYQREDWPVDALIDLNEAIRLDSANLTSYQYRQSYYLKHRRFKDALKDIDFLEERGVSSLQLLNNKLKVFYGQKRFDEFFQLAQNLPIESLLPVNRNCLAQYYLSNGDSLLAIQSLYHNYIDHTISIEETTFLAQLMVAEGFHEEAVKILSKLPKPETDLVKANILMNTGKPGEGSAILRKLSLAGNQKALLSLNAYFSAEQLKDSAIYYNSEYLQKYDSSTKILKLQGRHYQSRYLWAEALACYTTLLKKTPTDQEALREAGIVRGKIAYLRNLRSKRDSVSSFE